LQILFQGSVVEFETTHNKDLGNMARPCAINVKVLQLQVPIQFELRNVANLTESEEKSFIDGIRTASLIDCTSEIKVVVTDKERKRGTVKDFDYGFGFIEPDDLGEELFVHKTQVLTGHRKLFSGQRVEFSTGERGGRSVAINVEVLEGDSPPLQPNRVPLVSS
jgi:cold shock CspA family protein